MNERHTMVIAAPIARVWAMIDDAENLKRWMEGLVETTYPDGFDRRRAVGTRFVQRIREGGRVADYAGEIVTYDPPRHLGFVVGNSVFRMQVDYRLAEAAGGTRLDYSALLVDAGGVVRFMSRLFGWLTRRILRKQMARLRALAEAP